MLCIRPGSDAIRPDGKLRLPSSSHSSCRHGFAVFLPLRKAFLPSGSILDRCRKTLRLVKLCRGALLQATGCQMELSAEQVDAGEVDKLVQGIVQCANEVLMHTLLRVLSSSRHAVCRAAARSCHGSVQPSHVRSTCLISDPVSARVLFRV